MTCGIYEITHRRSGRRYVGSSVNIERRLKWHTTMLNNARHHCSFLQNVWAKYGQAAFDLRVLEECCVGSLAEREQHHMDATPPKQLMNSQPKAYSSAGWKHSPETREKLRAAAQRRAADPAHREHLRERALKQHAEGNLGRATWGPESDPGKEVWREVGKVQADRLRALAKATSSEEFSRRSYQRKIFKR